MRVGQTGWLFSGTLHVGVAVAALIGLPQLARDLPAPPPPINIEFVQIAEQTRVVAPKAPEQQRQQAPEKPQPNFAAAEASEPTLEDAAPLLEKAKPVKAAPVPKPKPRPQVSETRKLASRVTPRAKPKPPSRLKIKRIAAVIDRSIKEEQEQVQKAEELKKEAVKAPEPEKKLSLSQNLRGRIAVASIRDALSQKLSECWSFPIGNKGIEEMSVTIRISLRPDGSLLGRPTSIDAGDMSDGFYRVFVEGAQRAVQRCGPYSDVARQLFDMGENTIDFTFYPAEFAGG